MKKIISLLLTTVMLLSAFSFASFADEEWPFTDVKDTAWYYDGIAFCYYNGIVSGMTATTFQPNGTLTRAQFVQILAMFAEADLEAYRGADSGFDDVKANHWFNAPVCWAVEQGFVAGLSETKFGPNNAITREQLARLLYLFAESIGCDVSRLADLSGYTDKPSDWAYEQVQWAVAAGIISGMTETTIAPRATATRAQACRMMMNFVDFLVYGYRDTSGAYAAIVDYIKANGEYFSDMSYYSYYEANDGYDLIMEYVETDESISIAYLTEPYEIEEGSDIWINYRESASLYAYTLGSSYDFMYFYENANGTDYMNTYGYLGIDSYDEASSETVGYENTELTERATKAQKYIKEHIALILAEAGMTLEDFFLPAEPEYDDTREMYDRLVEYVCANGVEDTENGVIDLIKVEGDKAYVAEYEIATDILYFVYVSEPKAGGTDVYDTEYCEKAILALEWPLADDEMFIYSYEKEDGTRSISGMATTDGAELFNGNFDYSGYDQTTALNQINEALGETMSYYFEIWEQVFGEDAPM